MASASSSSLSWRLVRAAAWLGCTCSWTADSFVLPHPQRPQQPQRTNDRLSVPSATPVIALAAASSSSSSSSSTATAATARSDTAAAVVAPSPSSFIDTELRSAAMKLHTREQAPSEGQAPSQPQQGPAYVPTHADYLRFLVDSEHVYQALEEIVNDRDELAVFRGTGLERTQALAKDIAFMKKEYNLVQPPVGVAGRAYAELLRSIESVPEFVCHFYNFYFAHTAGGRMIGKQMSALLLDQKTLEFYQWEGDLNQLKAAVKDNIEAMAAAWSADERSACVNATPQTFQYAGAINKYLSGQAEQD